MKAISIYRSTQRVQMGDTDAASVIYMTAPLRWAEGLFTAWLADSGHPLSGMLASGTGFPAVKSEVLYHSPLRLDDVLEATLWVDRIGRRSMDLHSTFCKRTDTSIAVEVRVRHVYSSFSPDVAVERLPDWFLDLCPDAPGTEQLHHSSDHQPDNRYKG